MRRLYGPVGSLFVMLASACGGDDAQVVVDVSRPECENLNPLACMAPFPSDRYRIDGHLAMPLAAMPENTEGIHVDPEPYARFDGWSALSSLMTVVAGPVDQTELNGADRIAATLEPGSSTVILDAATGMRVAHFAEVDGWSDADPARISLYMRPAIRLAPAHRYIAAIRSLRRTDGTTIPPSEYFRALRDRLPTGAAELEARRPHFDDIFAKLETAGVPRAELLEAWDFTTASDELVTGDLVAMRDDAMMRVGAGGLGCHVDTVEMDYEPTQVYARVRGTFTVPLYMDGIDTGSRVNRGADGRPAFNGMAEAPFTVIIPASVAARVRAARGPARLVTFGHGLMGSGNGEVSGGYVRELSSRLELVMIATDWWGMSENDAVTVADSLSQMGGFPRVGERVMQGVINTLVLTRTFAGVCRNIPELQVDGMPVIDETERYFLGISQGAIYGLTTAAMSLDIERFVLNVGGISYPIMIPRSADFPDYRMILKAWYRDHIDRNLLMTMVATHWDLSEPAPYAPHVLHDPLPGSMPKRILYQTGVNDSQVPNVASDIAARTMGMPLLGSATYTPWNVMTTTAPADSAYVIYDTGAPPGPTGSVAPPEDTGAHGAVRRVDAAIRQMDAFWAPDGRVQNFCDGPCDPM